MNGTAANNDLSCLFSSITQVLDNAETGSLNITEVVQNCPNVCSLAWGTGNPDLSGVGVNISYILQAALVAIFGPLFLAVRNRLKKDFDEVHDAFLDASGQFCIIVAIAATVRLKQAAPFFEIAFLQSLITMQFLGLLSTSVAAAAILLDKQRKERNWQEDREVPRVGEATGGGEAPEVGEATGGRDYSREEVTGGGEALEAGEATGGREALKAGEAARGGEAPEAKEATRGGEAPGADEATGNREASEAGDAAGGREAPEVGEVETPQKEWPPEWRRLLAIVLYLVVEFGFFVGLLRHLRTSKDLWTIIQQLIAACRAYGSIQPGFIYAENHELYTIKIASAVAAVVGVALFYFTVYSLTPPLQKLLDKVVGPILCAVSLTSATGSLYFLVQLEYRRSAMKAVTGSNFADDQWGFGQVVAIFLWMPVPVSILLIYISRFPSTQSDFHKDILRESHLEVTAY